MEHGGNSRPPTADRTRSRAEQRAAAGNKTGDSINLADLERLQAAFEAADKDGSSGLELDEFLEAFGSVLGESTMTKLQLTHLFMKIDANSDGTVDWDEFTTFLLMETEAKAALGAQNDGFTEFLRIPDSGDETPPQELLAGAAVSVRGGMIPSGSAGGDGSSGGGSLGGGGGGGGERGGGGGGSMTGGVGSLGGADLGSSGGGTISGSLSGVGDGAPSMIGAYQQLDMIASMCYLEAQDRFLTTSRAGTWHLWNGSGLELVRTGRQASSSTWATSSAYMPLSQRVAVGTMDRRVVIYDSGSMDPVGSLSFTPGMNVLRSAPLCMSCTVLPGRCELLSIGDDGGNICLLRTDRMDSDYDADELGGQGDGRENLLLTAMRSAVGSSMGDTLTNSLAPGGHGTRDLRGGAGAGGAPSPMSRRAGAQNELWHICDGRGGVGCACVTPGLHASGARVHELRAVHSDWVTQVEYRNDLRSLISSSMDGTVRFSDIERSATSGSGGSNSRAASSSKRVFTGHSCGVFGFAFCKSYKFMASCGLERDVLVWDPYTCKKVVNLPGHAATVRHLLVDEPANVLVSCSVDKMIKVWDVRTFKCVQTLQEDQTYRPEDQVTCMFYEGSSRRLLTGGSRPHVWRMRDDSGLGLSSHTSAVAAALYNASFRQVVSADVGSDDKPSEIRVWDVDTGQRVFVFPAGGDRVTSLTFDHGRRRVVAGTHEGRVTVWNFSNGQCLSKYEDENRGRTGQGAGGGGGASRGGGAFGARRRKSALSRAARRGLPQRPRRQRFTAPIGLPEMEDERSIFDRMGDSDSDSAAKDGDNALNMDGEDGGPLLGLPNCMSLDAEVTAVEYVHMQEKGPDARASQHDRIILSAGWDRKIRAWKDGEGSSTPLYVLQPSSVSTSDTDSPASAGRKSPPSPRVGHGEDITCIACWGQFLASGDYSGRICIWKTENRSQLHRFRPSEAYLAATSTTDRAVEKMLYVPSQRALVTASADGVLRVWAPEEGVLRQEIRLGLPAGTGLSSLAVDETGMLLVVGTSAGHVRLYSFCCRREEVNSATSRQAATSNPAPRQGRGSICSPSNSRTSPTESAATQRTGGWPRPGAPPLQTQHGSAQAETLLRSGRAWLAHEGGSLCSTSFVAGDSHPTLLMTAASDCMIRLWTLDGQLVGMFGQGDHWVLGLPATYREFSARPQPDWALRAEPEVGALAYWPKPAATSGGEKREGGGSARPVAARAAGSPTTTLAVPGAFRPSFVNPEDLRETKASRWARERSLIMIQNAKAAGASDDETGNLTPRSPRSPRSPRPSITSSGKPPPSDGDLQRALATETASALPTCGGGVAGAGAGVRRVAPAKGAAPRSAAAPSASNPGRTDAPHLRTYPIEWVPYENNVEDQSVRGTVAGHGTAASLGAFGWPPDDAIESTVFTARSRAARLRHGSSLHQP